MLEEIRRLLSFLRRFLRLAGPYWNDSIPPENGKTQYWKHEGKWTVRLWAIALIALTVAQVLMPMWLNHWNADFFNALERRSWDDFLTEIAVIGAILVTSMSITSTHMWIKRKLQIGWRTWLTHRILGDWLAEGRHHQVTYLPGEHDNPDGRIAEDIRNAVESTIDLAHSLLYCLLLLVGFTQILWSLSGELSVEISGVLLTIPGYLVLIAMLYAAVFSFLALWLAQPLVTAAKHRQTAEADFRFELGRARENSFTIALLRGEPNERRRFGSLFHRLIKIWRIQSWALTRIMLFSSGYSVLSTAFPLLVAAPRYLIGTLTLGALMQTVQAFQQMILALSWPVDNVAKVSEWRGSGERVLSLHEALLELTKYTANPDQKKIVLIQTDQPILKVRSLCLAMPDGRLVVGGLNLEVHRGERVLISGDQEVATKLFKAVAGLWPWGRGRIELPRGVPLFFLPQQPYVPKGNLRAVVSYPTPSHDIEDVRLIAALEKVGLTALAQRLEETAAWDQVLTLAELQRLAFARLLLHKPEWIFIDEATDALEPEKEASLMRLLLQELPNATVLTISYRASLEEHHSRVLHLGKARAGQPLAHYEGLECDGF